MTAEESYEADLYWKNGKLNTVKGAGRYIDRPLFNNYYDAVKKRIEATEPTKVDR